MLIINAERESNQQKLPVAKRNLIIFSSIHSLRDLYFFVLWGQRTHNTNPKYYILKGTMMFP